MNNDTNPDILSNEELSICITVAIMRVCIYIPPNFCWMINYDDSTELDHLSAMANLAGRYPWNID